MQVLNKRISDDGVYIGRPSKFGNPFVMGKDGDRDEVVKKYEQFLMARPHLIKAAKHELRGKNLVCWCAPLACHGDVLLKIANESDMKYPYEEYVTTSDLGMRWYHTPSGALPSITTVLGVSDPPEKMLSLKRWQESLGAEKAAQKSKEATDHGTMVHLLAERFLKGEDPYAPVDGVPVPQKDSAGFNALKIDLRTINEVWGQEQSIYSPTLEVAGRFDCIGEYKGKPSVIDFKTSSRIKSREDIANYELQLCFYACAHNELFGTNIEQGVVLMSSAGGMPQVFIVRIEDHIEELVNRIQIFWEKVLPKIA